MNRVVVGVVLVVLAVGMVAVTSGEAGMTTYDGGEVVSEQTTERVALAETADEANETVRHRHPDDHPEDGDDLAGWLGGLLGDRLGDGVGQISEGQYERAREVLGDDYDERLGQFVNVTGADETEAESLREARDQQERLADLLAEFEETEQAYEQALAAGDAELARELAHDLVELAAEIEGLSRDIDDLIEEIEALLDVDFDEMKASLEEIDESVEQTRQEAVEETLTETELAVEAESERISFLDPLVASGQLRTVEGTAVANESVELAVAGERRTVETDGDGAFTVEYRPSELPVETEAVTVEYLPARGSGYAGSADNVSVRVEQVTPDLAVDVAPGSVGFGDEIQVDGTLAVEGIAVDNVTVDIVLAGEQLGTTNVSDGSFETSVAVPRAVPAGEHELRVRLPFEDRALAGVTETRPVTVEETATQLSLAATLVNDTADGAVADEDAGGETAIRVSGTLAADGTPLDGESLDVRVDGTTVSTVATDANGTFDATVSVPDDVDEEASVVVTYGGGGNLAPSQAEQTVQLPVAGEGPWLGSTGVLVAGAALAALLVGAGWWLWRRAESNETGGGVESDGERDSGHDQTGSQQVEVGSVFAQASDDLDAGDPDRAMEQCYAAVRRSLEASAGVTGALTHWEFYHAWRERAGDDRSEEAFRTVTETYERAAYGLERVSPTDARAVLDVARELCGLDSEGESGMAGDD